MGQSVFQWAAKSLVEGFASQVGGYAATQFLTAVGISEADDTRILNTLAEMDRKLDVIVEELGRISSQIERLALELKIDLLKIRQEVQAVAISSAITDIE